jgi:hypothetical protein
MRATPSLLPFPLEGFLALDRLDDRHHVPDLTIRKIG